MTLTLFAAAAAKTLDIYFIDVEGGQSTLIVTPEGESLLVDTGFAGQGFNDTLTNHGRDARRIIAAVHDARLQRLDYLLITHFHGDHVGGVVDVAAQISIDTFIDHDTVPDDADRGVPGTLDAFKLYAGVRDKARRHIVAKPGDRISLKGVDATIVSSAGETIRTALSGGGTRNATCASPFVAANETRENPRSTGFVLQSGSFRFADLGDLSGQPLSDLFCPTDLLGAVDVYLVAHHGGNDAAVPAAFSALKPRVSIFNNGETKGGGADTFKLLHSLTGIDVWQLHRTRNAGAVNFEEEHIANLDETTGHWLKLNANSDGSFTLTNGRTGKTKSYPKAAR